MVRDRLNHASYVAQQTIHHTDSAIELLSRPSIKIVDLASSRNSSQVRLPQPDWRQAIGLAHRLAGTAEHPQWRRTYRTGKAVRGMHASWSARGNQRISAMSAVQQADGRLNTIRC
jgi:hypothetical protein